MISELKRNCEYVKYKGKKNQVKLIPEIFERIILLKILLC